MSISIPASTDHNGFTQANPFTEQPSTTTKGFDSTSIESLELHAISNNRELSRRMAAKLAMQSKHTLSWINKDDQSGYHFPDGPQVIIWDIDETPAQLRQSIQNLRNRLDGQSIQVFGLLDRGAMRVLDRYLECGLDDWISKPLTANEFAPRLIRTADLLVLQEKLSHEQQNKRALKEAQHQWLSSIAHDLRNPLVSIRGLALFLKEGLEMKTSKESQADMLKSITDASDNLLAMVNDMSSFSSIEEQQCDLKTQEVDFYELVHNTFMLYKASASDKGIQMLFLNEDVPPPVTMDPVQISRVITNGLSNAIKYGRVGSTVTLAMRNQGNRVLLEIDNEGQTIPPHEFDLLFKPFGKTSVRPTRGEKSTGLGLAICKKIVEAHQGDLKLSNIEDHGVRFSLSLPISL